MKLSPSIFHLNSYSYFAQLRWPNGFHCVRCGYDRAYAIQSRRQPLYQCRSCRYQTSLTAGTIFEGSRTSLDKWKVAIELLSTTSSVNATQLKSIIQVTYKTAWRMLHRIRSAISAMDASRMQEGHVRAGLMFYGRPMFTYIRTEREHPVWISASDKRISSESSNEFNSKLSYIKMKCVPNKDIAGDKLNEQGEQRLFTTHATPTADSIMLNRGELAKDLLVKQVFNDAKEWLNRTFHGIGGKHLQSYWDEYCFRLNFGDGEGPLSERLARLCVTSF